MTLIKAVDVSNFQPASTAALNQWVQDGCQLLIIRAFTSAEPRRLWQSTRDWVAVAQNGGVWHLPYIWLYRSAAGAEQAQSAVELWADADGAVPAAAFFDCENYAPAGGPVLDPGPTVGQFLAAAGELGRLGGQASIMYANPEWMRHIEGDRTQLQGTGGWIASYNGRPDLQVENPLGLDVLGHQYTDTPVDWSVFDLERLTALVSPAPVDPCEALLAQLAEARTYVETAHRLRRRELRQLLAPR